MPRKSNSKTASIDDLSWKEFEDLVINFFRSLYNVPSFVMKQTSYSGDGGRDGYAEIEVLPQESVVDGMIYRLWIEAKKRSKGAALDLKDISGHAALAICAHANQLIFVTNTRFRKRATQILKELGNRNNMTVSFIEGAALSRELQRLCLKPQLGCERPEAEIELTKKGRPTSKRSAQQPDLEQQKMKFGAIQATKLELAVSFSHDPFFYDEALSDRTLVIERESASFMFIDLTLSGGDIAEQVQLKVSSSKNVEILPYIIQEGPILSTQGSRRYIYIVWPSCSCLSAHDIAVEARLGSHVEVVERRLGEVRLRSRAFNSWLPPSRVDLLSTLTSEIDSWLQSNRFSAVTFTASAGVGKSYLLNIARRHWLRRRVRELHLDGAIESDLARVVARIAKSIFPLPQPLIELETQSSLTELLRDLGIHEELLERVSGEVASVNSGSFQTLSISSIASYLSLLLARASQRAPLILVYEDLHKVDSSVVTLLNELRSSLSYIASCNVLLLTTSRYEPYLSFENPSETANWRSKHRSHLLYSLNIHIPSPTKREALLLLQHSLPRLTSYYCKLIIDQVGCTPFALKEALLYMLTTHIVNFDKELGEHVVTRPELLSQRLKLQQFSKSTELRLQSFRSMAPSWVSDVLDLAACIGKIFDLALCIKLVGTDDSSDTRIQIQECELLEIVRPSAVYSNCSEFEHDLLRRTICQSMGTHRQRRLANLLFEHYQETSPDNTRLLATLAYQAGRATECIEQSEAYTDYCEKQNNNAEALFGLFLKLIIVDSESEWHKRMLDFVYVDWDDAVATATPPEKEPLSQISKYEDTLSVMIRLLEKLSVVGSTTAEVTRALLSSAEMLSSKLSKTVALAKLKVIEGRYCFDENDFFAALASFQEAVSLCSQNDTAEAKEVKGLGMMFQGIIRRYIGETDEAYVDFLEAFKSRKRADWFLYRQLLANLGALYLPVDLRKTREYWQRGLSAMRCAKSSVAKQSYVHFVTNIAHLDILEDRLESAENLLLESRGSARKLGLRQELIRNHIQFGCLEMSRGRLHLAAEYFLEAEGLAVSTNHYRKLWRIRANLATIAELQGDIKQSYVYDLSVTKTSPPITLAQSLVDIDTDRMWRRTRATCAYANIALRSTTSTLHDKIIESLSSSVRTIAKNVAAAATSRTTECPGLLFFLKLFSVPRFIITD